MGTVPFTPGEEPGDKVSGGVMRKVTVLVPDEPERVAEFYERHGRWLGGLDVEDGEEVNAVESVNWTDSDQDLALARVVWAKLSPRAKALFELLMGTPNRKFSGEDLAETLDIPNGKYGVAGVLAWPGRHSHAVGRWLPVRYEEGPVGGSANYWMTSEVASLFGRAKND
jgi:hypothetical protein